MWQSASGIGETNKEFGSPTNFKELQCPREEKFVGRQRVCNEKRFMARKWKVYGNGKSSTRKHTINCGCLWGIVIGWEWVRKIYGLMNHYRFTANILHSRSGLCMAMSKAVTNFGHCVCCVCFAICFAFSFAFAIEGQWNVDWWWSVLRNYSGNKWKWWLYRVERFNNLCTPLNSSRLAMTMPILNFYYYFNNKINTSLHSLKIALPKRLSTNLNDIQYI